MSQPTYRPSKKQRIARKLQESIQASSQATRSSPNFRAEVVGISADGRKATIKREYNTAADGIAWPIRDRSRPLVVGDVVWAREENGGVIVEGAERKANEPPLVPRDGSVGFTGLPTIPTTPLLDSHPASKFYADTKETPTGAQNKANVAENSANQYTSGYTYSKAQADGRYAAANHPHPEYAAATHPHSNLVPYSAVAKHATATLPANYSWVITPNSSSI